MKNLLIILMSFHLVGFGQSNSNLLKNYSVKASLLTDDDVKGEKLLEFYVTADKDYIILGYSYKPSLFVIYEMKSFKKVGFVKIPGWVYDMSYSNDQKIFYSNLADYYQKTYQFSPNNKSVKATKNGKVTPSTELLCEKFELFSEVRTHVLSDSTYVFVYSDNLPKMLQIFKKNIKKKTIDNNVSHLGTEKQKDNIQVDKLELKTQLISSVDKDILKKKKVNNRYALIIGNEDYSSSQTGLETEQNVDYAVNDATIFKKYCLNTLGVKEDNMFFLTNAGSVKMKREIKRVTEIITVLGEDAELIFYYAGHGYPDEITKIPYLIPVDVAGEDLSYAIKLDDLYKSLGNTKSKRITMFLDACFTGGGRNSGLVSSRGVIVKPKEGSLNGNIVVFSASSEKQSAMPYHKEGHGVFTYHLLKSFQDSKGNISYKELFNKLVKDVNITSLKENSKKQEPKVNTSPKVETEWKDWTF